MKRSFEHGAIGGRSEFGPHSREQWPFKANRGSRSRFNLNASSSSLAGLRPIELGQDIAEDDVVLIEDYAYPIYGVPSEETKQAIRLVARLEGMIPDPVYEGKSMQGMIDLVNKGFFPKGSKVLYAHLGGAPALNGYAYAFRNG
jgi:1-aminocyclopropane-1-carboxylate deaminase/D-cysteine desulfhydrase-like pyridoxal-dependent ACC family enzyme